jgi:hypothetical protein
MPYSTSTARNELLPAYLWIYTERRCHMALGGLTPNSCMVNGWHEQPGGKAHPDGLVLSKH